MLWIWNMAWHAHSTTQACSRVVVACGWKLPSGMPLMTPALCSTCTAGRGVGGDAALIREGVTVVCSSCTPACCA